MKNKEQEMKQRARTGGTVIHFLVSFYVCHAWRWVATKVLGWSSAAPKLNGEALLLSVVVGNETGSTLAVSSSKERFMRLRILSIGIAHVAFNPRL